VLNKVNLTFNKIELLTTIDSTIKSICLDFALTTTAIVPDQSVFELRSYINQLRDFRQKHNLSGMYLDVKKQM
jgi:hypothetical protein